MPSSFLAKFIPVVDDSSADGSPKKQTKSIAPLKIKLFGGAQESLDSKQV